MQRVTEGRRTRQRQTGWWSKSEVVRARDDDVFNERNKDEEVYAGTSLRRTLRDVPEGGTSSGSFILRVLYTHAVFSHEAFI